MTPSTIRTDIEIHPQFTDPRLTPLLHPGRLLWTARELADLTDTVAATLTANLRELLRYDDEQRWWTRLALTESVELWLLSWLPGQHTRPHDHGGASGSFTVVHGELTEEYRYPGGPIRRRSHRAGRGIGFRAGRAHQVTGAGNTPTASVHAYSPPLVLMREYATLADILPVPTVVGT